jgi:outer membrane receptor protein involved in Fe transport
MRKALQLLFSISVLAIINSTLLAQTGGQIFGKVSDQNSAAVEFAKVILKSPATQTEQVVTTDSSGTFKFENLSSGLYRLAVEKKGFSAVTRSFTLVSSGERIEANIELLPGSITEVVSVTATRGEREIQDVPVRAETITAEAILKENITTTQDALNKTSNITPVGNGPFQMRPRLRGLDSSRILILVDGERLNTSRVATDRAGVEIGLIDPTSIQSLEVVSGSGSVLYGTDALSGTINILTDQPRTSASGIRVGGTLNTFYSTNENGRRGSARFDVSGRRFAFRFGGELERFENYHAGEGFNESSNFLFTEGKLRQQILSRVFPDPFNAPFTRTTSEVPNSQSHGSSVNAIARLFTSEKGGMRVNWLRRHNGNIGFPDFTAPFFSQTLNLPYSNVDKYGFRYERYGLTEWFSRVAFNVYHQQQDRDLRNDFAVFSSAPPGPNDPPFDSIIRIKLLTDTRQNVKSYGWDFQSNFKLGSRNILTTGASWFLDHSRDSRRTVTEAGIIAFASRPPSPPRLIPTSISFGPPSTTFPQRVPISDFQNLAFFAQDEYDVTRWLRIVGGVRVDKFDVSAKATPGYNPVLPGISNATPAIDLSKLPTASGVGINRTSVSGDIGIIVRPNDVMSFTARIGRSFRHPNLEELFFSGPATLGNAVPNITVKPETGINFDTGLRIRKARYAASLSYFNNNYRNFISTEIVSQSPSIGLILQAINFAKLRIQGFEFDSEYSINARRSIFTPFLNVGYLHGQIIEAVNPFNSSKLSNVPADNITPLKAVAGLRWSSPGGRFWGEYNVRAQSKVERVSPLLSESPFLIAQDFFSLGGFAVQNLRGGYNFQRENSRVALTFGLENSGNKFYREHFQFAPSRGRSLTVGLLLKVF